MAVVQLSLALGRDPRSSTCWKYCPERRSYQRLVPPRRSVRDRHHHAAAASRGWSRAGGRRGLHLRPSGKAAFGDELVDSRFTRRVYRPVCAGPNRLSGGA